MGQGAPSHRRALDVPRTKPEPKRTEKRRPRTYTEKQREQALELYGTMSVSALSRKLKIPKSTLGRWAAKAGIRGIRAAQVEAAVRARQADFAARRQNLKEVLLTDAERLEGQLWKKCKVYNFGGKDNSFAEQEIPEPGFRDKREICTSIGILVDKVDKLEKMDDHTDDRAAVDEWLATLKGRS